MKNSLDTTHEICKLLKFSPRRQGIFKSVKENFPSSSSVGIRVLCPTRWTVRAHALKSIISNYKVLQSTWEEATTVTQDTEAKARIQGVSTQMRKFEFLYGTLLGELVLMHTDNLSSSLQNKSISASEGQQLMQLTVATLKSIRSDQSFDIFWEKVTTMAAELSVGEAKLPRPRQLPRRYDDGLCRGDRHETPKAYFRQIFYESMDMIIGCIQNRFNQPGYVLYSSLETLLTKAAKQEEFEADLHKVCSFYKDDLDEGILNAQLKTFGLHFQQQQLSHEKETGKNSSLTISDIKSYFGSISHGQTVFFSEVKRVIQLVLVMPATNATSERSFSTLRRVKNYLRSTMKQERLNYMMLLNVHTNNDR